VLVVLDRCEEVAWLSLRNIPTVHVLAVDQLNAYDVLVADSVVFTSAALAAFTTRGAGSPEGFTDIVEPLADVLGGAVGVTRDVVDSGYYPGQFQIGQTGVTVSPDLYIGLGVSGAIQHKSGMQTAKKIIVINNDEDAPLFEIADLGVVGDLFDIAPKLIEEIKKRG